MTRIIILTIIFISVFGSCKNKVANEQTSGRQKELSTKEIEPAENHPKEKQIVKKRFVDEDRATAKTELNDFFKNKYKPVLFLSKDYFVVDYISNGKEGPKDMIDFGEWYKFNPDFSYSHGFFSEIKDKGKYSYDLNKELLMMLPDDKKLYPSEWKTLKSGDVIVLVGTAKFSNNPFQKHMQNVKEKTELKK